MVDLSVSDVLASHLLPLRKVLRRGLLGVELANVGEVDLKSHVDEKSPPELERVGVNKATAICIIAKVCCQTDYIHDIACYHAYPI